MFTLSRDDKHSLLRMRYAFRSSEALSALIAAALLWPLVGLIVPVGVMLMAQSLRAGSLRALLVSFFTSGAVTLLVLALWRMLDWFFYSAGCLVSVVSLLLSALFMYLFRVSSTQLWILAASKKSEFGVTLSVALTLATFIFFWRHTVRIGLLHREERAVITQRWPGRSVAQHFFGSLSNHRRGTRRSFSAVAATVLRTAAMMVQGLSIYVLFFMLGVALFNLTMFFLTVYYFFFDRSRVGSFEGFSLIAGYVIAFCGIMLTAAFLITQGAMALKRSARWLSRYSFEQTVAADPRPPILFLRSFADDQVTLPRPPFYVTYWLAEPNPRRLDHALVERFSNLAPVVALGKRGEKNLPYGASRRYVSDDEWQDVVEEIATGAHSIVIIADDSPGVEWEVRRMLEEPFVRKSLFLASPGRGKQGLEAHPLVGPAVASASVNLSKGFRILAAFREAERWQILAIKKPTADDFVVCCQAFFRSRSTAESSVYVEATSGKASGVEPF
ncbi:MAG TPA: hypothetical protein VN282_14460 [Pyrinomonadaceae bacterium]|nr:hypothetical protein [Pyrinomonadaceae bacterium]